MEEHGDRLDEESLRTLMCEVEAVINSRPLTVVSGEPNDLEPLTPSHLLTTKSAVVLPPPGKFQRNDIYMRRRWRRVQYLTNLFWSRWKKEYLVSLQERVKWQQPKRNLTEGDIVILREENVRRNVWPSGIVIKQTELCQVGYRQDTRIQSEKTSQQTCSATAQRGSARR